MQLLSVTTLPAFPDGKYTCCIKRGKCFLYASKLIPKVLLKVKLCFVCGLGLKDAIGCCAKRTTFELPKVFPQSGVRAAWLVCALVVSLCRKLRYISLMAT
ncbi:unnamed protein product [Larinioides sclopetarius]|uniref:Uncharacterized protein n=1 Tax=Larinioides sclopetarius TaxID=280406 RepID=A0AAV2A3Q0_9ARAC